MSRVELDPEPGRAVAARLKALGVKGILIKAAEQGYITKLECKMPKCFCPEELGGAGYFEPDKRSDWSPTHEHFPLPKKDGGHRQVDNAVLAHRLCNRIDHSIRVGRGHKRDLRGSGKPARKRRDATMNGPLPSSRPPRRPSAPRVNRPRSPPSSPLCPRACPSSRWLLRAGRRGGRPGATCLWLR